MTLSVCVQLFQCLFHVSYEGHVCLFASLHVIVSRSAQLIDEYCSMTDKEL